MSMSVEIPKEMEQILISLSKESNMSSSELMLIALRNSLEDMRDYYLALKAKKRIEDGEKTYLGDDVFRELGLE